MLAPLTNCQSHDDGCLSDAEQDWLMMRARGGFGLTMTCAAFVQPDGRGYPGQLGAFSDDNITGLARLADAMRATGTLSSVQLFHAGHRTTTALAGEVVSASREAASGARAMTTGEVETTIENFISAAERVDRAGIDGVELHAAHGYLLSRFLSAGTNDRTDRFGGSLANRARMIFAIIDGIRERCRPNFQLGIRIAPEQWGMRMDETIELAGQLFDGGKLDYIDFSLWDVFKEPEETAWRGRTLLSCFTGLPRGGTRLGCAGKIGSGADVERALDEGADFVVIGRAAMLHHDFPARIGRDRGFATESFPTTRDRLRPEGASPAFIDYLDRLKMFLVD